MNPCRRPAQCVDAGFGPETCSYCNPPLYNVIATEIKTGKVRVIAENKTEDNADAIVEMAVLRRGVDDEFFSVAPSAPAAKPIGSIRDE